MFSNINSPGVASSSSSSSSYPPQQFNPLIKLQSTLETTPFEIKWIDEKRGRGLFTKSPVAQPDTNIFFGERPVAFVQHVHNRGSASTCAECCRFLGSLEDQLIYHMRRCGLFEIEENKKGGKGKGKGASSGAKLAQLKERKAREAISNAKSFLAPDDPIRLANGSQSVECPNGCGERYCSQECQRKSYVEHHALLCVGLLDSVHAPLYLFKQYCVNNSELLLQAVTLIMKTSSSWLAQGAPEGDLGKSIMTEIFSVFHHKAWWEVVQETPTEELKTMITYSLKLLHNSLLPAIYQHLATFRGVENVTGSVVEILFTEEYWAHLCGLLELNNNSIEFSSPLQMLYDQLQIFPPEVREATLKVLEPVIDRIDELKNEGDEDDDEEMEEEEEEETESECSSGFPSFEGFGLFPLCAMMNHSCEPNCEVRFKYDNAAIITSKGSIVAGSELVHSYIEDKNPIQERRSELMGYGFLCECPKCQRECHPIIKPF